MLVLSRKLGEKIFIGENICITVVDIDRGKIKLGIEAPRDVPIYRQELLPINSAIQKNDHLPEVASGNMSGTIYPPTEIPNGQVQETAGGLENGTAGNQ